MKYNFSIRLSHGILAFLIIAQLIIGFGISNHIIAPSWIGWTIVLHKSFGLTSLFVVCLLIALKIISPRVPYSEPLPVLQYIAAKIVHFGLYISVLGMSLSGLLANMLLNYNWKIFFVIPFPHFFATNKPLAHYIFGFHGFFANILLTLVVLHILAALYHHFVTKDKIMSRML